MNWEQRYRTGDTPWEKGAPAPPLLDWIRERGALSGSILVPGCGNGNDVRALAAAAPAAEVVGFDIAPSAIGQARQHPRAGSEVYRIADLFHLPADLANRFDWVFEHTCFCTLEPARRADYVRAVAGVLRGEGAPLAVFFSTRGTPAKRPLKVGLPSERAGKNSTPYSRTISDWSRN
jgi:methyl halide transferase